METRYGIRATVRRVSRFTLAVASAALIAAGCGGGGSGSSDEDFEAAEDSIHEIQSTLDEVIKHYETGNKSRALELAETAGLDMYEGPTEGVVADVSPTVNRQLDPLIEATIPAKVRAGVEFGELQTHVLRAHELLAEALEEIEKAEHE